MSDESNATMNNLIRRAAGRLPVEPDQAAKDVPGVSGGLLATLRQVIWGDDDGGDA